MAAPTVLLLGVVEMVDGSQPTAAASFAMAVFGGRMERMMVGWIALTTAEKNYI